MTFKQTFLPEKFLLFRYLFFGFAVAIPFITQWIPELNPLYIALAILSGIGFYNKSKTFLFFSCILITTIRAASIEGTESIVSFLVRLCMYWLVSVISSDIVERYHETSKHHTELTFALAKSLDARDTYTAHHSGNVATYSSKIAREMNLSDDQCEAIYLGGLLHDIGKIGIPESILTKPSRLSEEEFECIKAHTTIGYRTINHIKSFKDKGILEMVLYHHEQYDGNGYPKGLKGKEIPLAARIISVADSFDAITTKRSYKPCIPLEYAVREIKNNKGTRYDPEVVDAFLRILEREGPQFIVHQIDRETVTL